MQEWYTEEYAAERRRQYEEIRSEFPEFVTVRFECNAGWCALLREFFAAVQKAVPSGNETAFALFQVKEKFAGLRIYYQLGGDLPDAARAAIDSAYKTAEESAERTCEVCGKPGLLRARGGWYATRCDEHADGGIPVPKEDAQ